MTTVSATLRSLGIDAAYPDHLHVDGGEVCQGPARIPGGKGAKTDPVRFGVTMDQVLAAVPAIVHPQVGRCEVGRNPAGGVHVVIDGRAQRMGESALMQALLGEMADLEVAS